MLVTIERATFLVPRAPYIFSAFNAFLGLLVVGVAIEFKAGDGQGWFILMTTLVFSCVGMVHGVFVKYKAKFSVQYEINSIILGYLLLAVAMGGGAALLAADVSGASHKRLIVLIIYELSILLPLWFGAKRRFSGLGYYQAVRTGEWKKKFKGAVDFDRYIVMPDRSAALSPERSPLASVWMWAPVTVNVPLLFQIYTGSKNNAIFLAVPLLVGAFAYLSLKVLGPKIANLYVLRQYEKQTSRRFVNADYEKIQELRRTFFLSRWLMKDYRPAAKQ